MFAIIGYSTNPNLSQRIRNLLTNHTVPTIASDCIAAVGVAQTNNLLISAKHLIADRNAKIRPWPQHHWKTHFEADENSLLVRRCDEKVYFADIRKATNQFVMSNDLNVLSETLCELKLFKQSHLIQMPPGHLWFFSPASTRIQILKLQIQEGHYKIIS
jgi:hypothetical protein